MPSYCWHQHTRTASWFALINPCAASLIFDPRPRSLPRAHDSLRRLSLTPARRSGVPLTSEAVAIGVARARLLALARSGKRSDRRSQQSVVIPPSSARSGHALSSKYRATYAVTARRQAQQCCVSRIASTDFVILNKIVIAVMTSIGLALRLGFTSVCCLRRCIVRRPNEFAILVWGSILGRSRLMFLAAIVKFCWIAAFLIASRAFAVSSSTGCSYNSHALGTGVAKWHYSIHLLNCSRVQSREEVVTFFCRAMDCSISCSQKGRRLGIELMLLPALPCTCE